MGDTDSGLELVRSLTTTERVNGFAGALYDWLMTTASLRQDRTALTESQARLLLQAIGHLDQEAPVLQEPFASQARRRTTLYQLLGETGLATEEEVQQLPAGDPRQPTARVPWLALVVSALGWQAGYDVSQLDPNSPPARHTPAGEVLQRTLRFLYRETERSQAEIERLEVHLSEPATDANPRASGELGGEPVPPLPPHFRPPIPERYPEMARETIRVRADDIPAGEVRSPSEPLVIGPEDLDEQTTDEPLRVEAEPTVPARQRPPSPLPSSGVILPNSTSHSRSSLTLALRQLFRQEELKSTRLLILVQRHPDGPGLEGLQVRVSCKGIKSHLAGVTKADGTFGCELPVRQNSGLTYDVAVTWPRELGGSVEQKSITLNADRTRFQLPFYYQLSAPESE